MAEPPRYLPAGVDYSPASVPRARSHLRNLSVGADSSPVSVPTTSLHEHSAPHNIRTYNQSTRAPDASLVLGVWSVSWARVQVVVWLHVVVRLPERDEGGGFSVSFVSFAKFRKVSGRAAAGRPSGGVGPANGLCEAIIMAGARESVRCARSAEQEAGLMRAARRLCSSRLRVRVSGLGVCVSCRARAVRVRSVRAVWVRGGAWPCWTSGRRRAWCEPWRR